jgi:Spy/CpxP family protein refolding chaperone
MTASRAAGLQKSAHRLFPGGPGFSCNRRLRRAVIIGKQRTTRAQQPKNYESKITDTDNRATLQAGEHGEKGEGRHGDRGGHHKMMGFGMKHMTKDLDLTPQQKAQVDPIIEQVKPQMKAIHEEAMAKSHAIMEDAMAKIRPLLTPEQVQKLDKMKAAHEKMRDAMKEMHEAKED